MCMCLPSKSIQMNRVKATREDTEGEGKRSWWGVRQAADREFWIADVEASHWAPWFYNDVKRKNHNKQIRWMASCITYLLKKVILWWWYTVGALYTFVGCWLLAVFRCLRVRVEQCFYSLSLLVFKSQQYEPKRTQGSIGSKYKVSVCESLLI